jgi:hypothetical protein
MIKYTHWISLNSTETPIRELGTRHLANAIAVVERNDPRYGVRNGAAYPGLLAEMVRRANAGDQEAIDHEVGAGRRSLSFTEKFRKARLNEDAWKSVVDGHAYDFKTSEKLRQSVEDGIKRHGFRATLFGTPLVPPGGPTGPTGPARVDVADDVRRAHARLDMYFGRLEDLRSRVSVIESGPKKRTTKKTKKPSTKRKAKRS